MLSECKATNRTIRFIWNAPPSAVDAYHLEADIYTPTQAPNEKEHRETVKLSLGTTCKYNLECLHYNARVTARVCASNRAGEGPFSEDVTIYTKKGKVWKNYFMFSLILDLGDA